MKEEILVKLRHAEEQNASRVAAAKDRAAEIRKQGRNEADRVVEQAHEEAKKAEEARLAAERKKLETERSKILAEGAKKEESLRAAYKNKVERHVAKALERFEGSL